MRAVWLAERESVPRVEITASWPERAEVREGSEV